MRWLALIVLLLLPLQADAQRIKFTMCPLASDLTRLAKAVDVYVADTPAAGSLRDEELLESATRHDPSLLTPFFSYYVGVQVEGRNSSVLVCTRDRKAGLLEDAGCSPEMDAHLWSDSSHLCGFTLNLSAVCRGASPPSANACR